MDAKCCSANRCFKDATQSVHLRWWAAGHPRDTHPPCISEPVVYVCDDHVAFARESQWYGPEQRRQINEGMDSVGRARPDYETADVIFRPFTVDGDSKHG